jgi:hypothetical protein
MFTPEERATLQDAKLSLEHALVFIQTREKMHPDGVHLHLESIVKLSQLLDEDEIEGATR